MIAGTVTPIINGSLLLFFLLLPPPLEEPLSLSAGIIVLQDAPAAQRSGFPDDLHPQKIEVQTVNTKAKKKEKYICKNRTCSKLVFCLNKIKNRT